VIELKQYFGVTLKIWIQAALRNQWEYLSTHKGMRWALSRRVTYSDLLLVYRCYRQCCIPDLFKVTDVRLKPGQPDWRVGGIVYFGGIQRVCQLDSPVFLPEVRHIRYCEQLPSSGRTCRGEVGGWFQNAGLILTPMLYERSAKHRRLPMKYAPAREKESVLVP
jgi:hypothetical protein